MVVFIGFTNPLLPLKVQVGKPHFQMLYTYTSVFHILLVNGRILPPLYPRCTSTFALAAFSFLMSQIYELLFNLKLERTSQAAMDSIFRRFEVERVD
jgi:hypothetical protein